MVADGLATLVEESLDDILCMSYHDAQSGFPSVVYNYVEKFMLDLLCKNFISETFDAHVAKLFYTDAAADRVPKKLLTPRSFMAPTATFEQRKPDTAIENKNKVLAKASNVDLVAATEVYGEIIKEPPSRSDSGSEQPHRTRFPRRRWKNRQAEREDRHARR